MLLIRTRLALALVIILALVLTTFSVVIYQTTRSNLLSEVERDVRQRATSIALASVPANEQQAMRLPRMDVFTAPDTYIQVRGQDGRILASSGNLGNRALPLIQSAIRSHQVVEAHLGGVPLFVYARPVVASGRVLGYVVVARTPRTIYQALNRLRQLLYPGAAVALLLSGLIVWLLVWWSLRLLARLDTRAAEIAATRDHTRRVPMTQRSDEIGRLSRTINGMLEALDEAYRQVQRLSDLQRQFLADVSHELRRPLTIMLSSLDVMKKVGATDPEFQEKTLADMRVEADRMARMVTQLLILARTDANTIVPREPVLLADVLEEACQQGRPPETEAPALRTDLERLDGVVVRGNVDYLKQLFLILLDNAFKYTPKNGRVDVIAEPNGRRVEVTVADTGIGIAANDLDHIFDRFYRAGNTRHLPGMGLGLAIARHIVEQHEGAIRVESEPGRGSRFTVSLPLLTDR
jgi:signal transduction histidine kinase